MSTVNDAYNGSSGEATVSVYKRLEALGPVGFIAMNLLRACKASERAKKYRGGNGHGSYRSQAYDKKDWSLAQLVSALGSHAESAGISWGWGYDAKAVAFEHVLYVELPGFGQVSFHNRSRYSGPDHSLPWDEVRGIGSSRIIRFATDLLGEPQPAETQGERDVRLRKNGTEGTEAPRAEGGARYPRRRRNTKPAGSRRPPEDGGPSFI